MPIYLGGNTEEKEYFKSFDELTPSQIVAELDKFVVGQTAAKRAVAIALRSRIRRQKLPPEIARDVIPKNILMIGPTGVGKTEIARRLARLAGSPFIKVEASKFTEVGYVGRDVESIIRELTETGIEMVKQSAFRDVLEQAKTNVENRLLKLLYPSADINDQNDFYATSEAAVIENSESQNRTLSKLREKLRSGELDEKIIEIEMQERSTQMIDFSGGQGMEEMGINFNEMLGNMFPKKTKRRKIRISEAREYFLREEQEDLIDLEQITREAIHKVENSGIVFLDEIDKITGREAQGGQPDISREGVQRDLLPIVEGTNVTTKYGLINTDHILFIAAGAFHVSKPSEMIPELQGRFPIRVELSALTIEDIKHILTQPQNSLIKQYRALLNTEGINLEFTEDAVDALAEMTAQINSSSENIGARRLHTLLEKLLEEINFAGSELSETEQTIDAAYVKSRLAPLVSNQDINQYIL